MSMRALVLPFSMDQSWIVFLSRHWSLSAVLAAWKVWLRLWLWVSSFPAVEPRAGRGWLIYLLIFMQETIDRRQAIKSQKAQKLVLVQFHIEFFKFSSMEIKIFCFGFEQKSPVSAEMESEKKSLEKLTYQISHIFGVKWPGHKSDVFLFCFPLNAPMQSPQCHQCAEICYNHCFLLFNGQHAHELFS